MKIASWNISSGINTSSYKDNLFDVKPSVAADDDCVNQIASLIKNLGIDVIALQEVITTPSFKFLKTLSKLTGLKYYDYFENSPGFLIKNTNFGVAVLSRYPFKVVCKTMLKNPNLTAKTEKGSYTTHDKGYIAIKLNNADLCILSTQFLPFHRFNSTIEEHKALFNEFQTFAIKNNAILCGDFNAIKGKSSLQVVLDKVCKTHNFVFDAVTTSDGKKSDNILVPKNITVKNSYLETKITPSDHYLCVIEI